MRAPVRPVVLAAAAAVLLVAPVAGPAVADTAPAAVGGEQLATAGLVVDAPGAEPLPKVRAASYLLADLTTGEVLAAQDPHGRLRPASTLKILTALTLLPELDPAAVYTAQWEDANAEGSRAGLVPDATYTVDQLFQALFLVSGNDAASALANAAGGVPGTVAAMNATAKGLGALDTTVRNPSGLDAPGQYTSAYDLAVIARTAMAREDFRDYADDGQGAVPRQDAQGRQGSQDLRDLHAGPAAAELPRRHRDQDRLDHEGARHLRGSGHPRRPDAGRHCAAQRGQRHLA